MGNEILTVFLKRLILLRKDENGGVLVITLAVFLFLFLSCAGIYTVGSTIQQRIELQNACDAAAYSAATIQADGLSRIATINKAMAWTYIQMTNRQMDYITYKWLKETERRYTYDKKEAENWAKKGITYCCRKGTSFCHNFVINGYPTFGVDQILRILNEIDSKFNIHEGGFLGILKLGIYADMQNIDAMNKTLEEVQKSMVCNPNPQESDKDNYNSIPKTIRYVLEKNLSRTQSSGNAWSNGNLLGNLNTKNVLEDYYMYYHVPYSQSPYSINVSKQNGYYLPLLNTEAHERIFLQMAMPNVQVDKHFNFFYNDKNDNKFACGIDQWFVRGCEINHNGENHGFPAFSNGATDNYGLHRVYKSANVNEKPVHIARSNHLLNISGHVSGVRRYGQIFNSVANVINSRLGQLIDMPPSCWNLKICENNRKSVALYSQYEWGASQHFCYISGFPPRVNHIHIPKWYCGQAKNVMVAAFTDVSTKHGYFGANEITKIGTHYAGLAEKIAKGGEYKRNEYNSCEIVPYNDYYIKLAGFARIYGDDNQIFEEDIWHTKWHTERGTYPLKAKPWILSRTFFDGDKDTGKGSGTILVGVARKQRNPFERFIGDVVKGVFSAFNPTSSTNYMWAVSASRAAYKHSITGKYHISYDDPNEQLYKHSGCACRFADTSKYIWNLCQTDWVGALLPVRYATRGANNILENRWNDTKGTNIVDPISYMYLGNNKNWIRLSDNSEKAGEEIMTLKIPSSSSAHRGIKMLKLENIIKYKVN